MGYKQRWDNLFTAVDKDKSGFIDPADLNLAYALAAKVIQKPINAPQVQQAVEGYTNLFHGIIRDFDKNSDGRVSKDELIAGVEKHFVGKTPDSLPDWWRESAKSMLRAADTNNSGELSLEETAAYLKRVDPSLSDEDIAKAFEWLKSLGSTGKLDDTAISNLFLLWATSPDDNPLLSVFMAPVYSL